MNRASQNAFESGSRKVIPSTLIYVFHQGKVLMIHRRSKDALRSDIHEGKWNGLGGKCEQDESPLMAAQRELHEESGLCLPPSQFKSVGVIQFPNFKPQKSEDWLVFLFRVDLEGVSDPQVLRENGEGTLHWILVSDILNLNLWPGDVLFLPPVLKGQSVMGTIWYEKGQVKDSWIQFLS